MEWLEGEALGARIVRAPAYEQLRPRLAYECGKLMAKIHQIDLDATGLRSRLFEITPKEFVEQSWERYRLLETPQPMIDFTARWLMEHLPVAPQMRLVHNDFRNGNFLVDETKVVAVLREDDAGEIFATVKGKFIFNLPLGLETLATSTR